jgi:hypothetical protein
MGKIDLTLFIKYKNHDLIIVQIYVDILFDVTNESLCQKFEYYMHKEFEMSMIKEFTFFLIHQIKLENDDIFIIQAKFGIHMFKQTLIYLVFKLNHNIIFYDNTNDINVTENPF